MHREAQRNAESFREATRRTERPKRAQKDPESPTQKCPETPSMDKKACHELGWLAGELAGWLPHDDSVNKLALHDLGHPGATL